MNIALICANETPIPATMGGATETMMTHMLEVNEECRDNTFHVFSFFEPNAEKASKHYKSTIFHYYKPNKTYVAINDVFWRVMRKLSSEKLYLHSPFIKWCSNYLAKEKYDVVVIEGNCFQVEYMRSLLGSQKIILHMHIDRLNTELKAAQHMINVSDGVFVISDFCKKRIMEVDSSAESKTVVVKNTIDTEKFTFRGTDIKRTIRNDLNVCQEQKIVTYWGRIEQAKGVIELVRAMKLLDDPNLHLLIIGSSVYMGSKKSDYMEKVELESKGLKGGVSFTGYIPQNTLPQYISATDIAVVPSLCNEAAGNVIIEALSCGVPVVASSQGGIPEYADLSACRLVDYCDSFVDDLAKQIHELAYNTALYDRLKANTRKVAVQYDKHNYYINFCNAIKQILER